MTISINQVQLRGYIGNLSEEIKTEKSSFRTLSVSTQRGKKTDWHKIIIFNTEDVKIASSFELGVGDYIRIDGELSYRNRDIKDAEGNVIVTVKEASVIANIIFGLEQRKPKTK